MEFDYQLNLLLMIFMRMSGCIMLNPIIGRKDIPNIFKIGLSLILSLFIYKIVPTNELQINSFMMFFILGIRELVVGFIIGYILSLFQSVIIMGGEMMDMQIGISMSKVYDPQSNISMPLSASLINTMFILIFFSTNAYLTLIRIFAKLCEVVPYGELYVNPNIFKSLVSLFSLMLIYAVKLSLPMIAVQLVSEVGVGLIMRAVPQIDIFAVEIQLKILLGFVLILVMVPPLSSFLENLIALMFDNISSALAAFT